MGTLKTLFLIIISATLFTACGPSGNGGSAASFTPNDSTGNTINLGENPGPKPITNDTLGGICKNVLFNTKPECVTELQTIVTTENYTTNAQIERHVMSNLGNAKLNKIIIGTFKFFLHRMPNDYEKRVSRALLSGDDGLAGEPISLNKKIGQAMTRGQYRTKIINSLEAYSVRLFHCAAKLKDSCSLATVPETKKQMVFAGNDTQVKYGFYYKDGIKYDRKPAKRRFSTKERNKIMDMIEDGATPAELMTEIKKALKSLVRPDSKSVRKALKKVKDLKKKLKKQNMTLKKAQKAFNKAKKAKKGVKAARKKMNKAKNARNKTRKALKKAENKLKNVKKKNQDQVKKARAKVERMEKKLDDAKKEGAGVEQAEANLKKAKQQLKKAILD